MADLLGMSARYIDEGAIPEGDTSPLDRRSRELSQIADGVAVIEAFSHVLAFRTDEGLVLFDTSHEAHARPIIENMRKWTKDPVHSIAFTHGHIDHVGGAKAFVDEAADAGNPRPRFIAHENVDARIDRYQLTSGYNRIINQRQFSRGRRGGVQPDRPFGPAEWVRPDTTFQNRLTVRVGDETVEMRHDRGETDDHLWAWVPEHKAICSGDFVTWVFPNAGNPQKVQRFPLEWAKALREMAAKEPELLLPAHGLPIAGKDRIAGVLDTIASALEFLVSRSLDMMNGGARLDDLIHGVKLPAHYMDKPYLKPVYDEPEFIIHNIWRLYGGWYDGNPSRLKPAPDAVVAAEIARLAGGVAKLCQRAEELAATAKEED
ncbi:MAG: alkyl sulfatase dimerization domain-containing protein, partial [Parvibaculum sp.]